MIGKEIAMGFEAILASAGANSTLTAYDWSSLDVSLFQPLVTGLNSILPIVIAVAIPLIVLRKGWSFLKGNIYSA